MDDLFLNNKGKALRNKQKKMDKITQTQKAINKGEVTPTDAQKEMLAGKAALQAEIKELQELCDLYLRSNPNCLAKKPAPEQTPAADPDAELAAALSIAAKMFQLKAERAVLPAQSKSLEALRAASGAELLKLARKTNDLICEGGCTFRAFFDFVEYQHHRQEVEEDKEEVVISDGAVDLCADFEVFDCDVPAAKPTPPADKPAEDKPAEDKPAQPEPAQVAATPQPEPTPVAAPVEESKETAAAADETAPADEDKQEQSERRGNRGDYRGRRPDDRGRGGYRGRGGQNRGPREDEDGFIVETGEKPKPRRDNRGRGRGDYRGDRRGGRGEYRGERGGERVDRRGGNRPKTEGTTQPAEQQQQSQQ